MSHLLINDLNFCESELSNPGNIVGSGSPFSVQFDFDSIFGLDLAGEGGAGYGVAIAIGIGGSGLTAVTNVFTLKIVG